MCVAWAFSLDRSFVPTGTLRIVVPRNPAMNCWAIVERP